MEVGQVCDNLFPKKSQLRNHAEIHVNGLSYECLYCSDIRPNKTSLKSHIRIKHRDMSGPKPSSSGILTTNKTGELQTDKSESDIVELIPPDMNREISEKIQELVVKETGTDWRCTKCFKTFTRKSNLLNHLETHLNYSHSCPRCNFHTSVRNALKIHYRVTHQNLK